MLYTIRTAQELWDVVGSSITVTIWSRWNGYECVGAGGTISGNRAVQTSFSIDLNKPFSYAAY